MPDLSILIGNQLSKGAAETTLTLEELISSMSASGMDNQSIKDVLMNDLTTGGRLFGPFRNSVKNTVKSGMGMAANEASRTTFEKAGVQEFKWVSIGDKSVCIDCEERHGEIDTMEYFKTVGLPRSGFSICQFSCRCQLVPATYDGENLNEPLLRKKIKEDKFPGLDLGTLKKSDFKSIDNYTDSVGFGLANKRGFNGLPKSVSSQKIDELVDSGGYVMYRSVANSDLADRFLKGDLPIGSGAYGAGIYAGGGASGINMAGLYHQKGGVMFRMALDKNAKVISYKEIRKMMKADNDLLKYGDDLLNQGFEDRNRDLVDLGKDIGSISEDTGRYAIYKGYDAIIIDHGNEIGEMMGFGKGRSLEVVVLNRKALYVDRDFIYD